MKKYSENYEALTAERTLQPVPQQLFAHTPGPWSLDDGLPGGVYSNDATGSIVARCVGIGFEFVWRPAAESRANARLIAAAPDMLAALQEIAALKLPDDPAGLSWEEHGAFLREAAGEIASAAIAKASASATQVER